jgi:hypothetical protein
MNTPEVKNLNVSVKNTVMLLKEFEIWEWARAYSFSVT